MLILAQILILVGYTRQSHLHQHMQQQNDVVGASKRWGKGERIRENREVYKKGRIDKRHALGK